MSKNPTRVKAIKIYFDMDILGHRLSTKIQKSESHEYPIELIYSDWDTVFDAQGFEYEKENQIQVIPMSIKDTKELINLLNEALKEAGKIEEIPRKP